MSFEALAWASRQHPGNMAAKMVLFCLSSYANEHGEAYPSTAAIAEFGDMNHKTATAALDRLEALNLITDSGKRVGKSGQIKVYKLALNIDVKPPKNSPPKKEASQKRKPPVFSVKDPQKRVTDTIRDTVDNKAKALSSRRDAVFELPNWIPEEAWNGWLAMRVKIKKEPTPYAIELAIGELEKLRRDGHDPGRVLNQSTLNHWRGLFPLKDDQNARSYDNRNGSRQSAFGQTYKPSAALALYREGIASGESGDWQDWPEVSASLGG